MRIGILADVHANLQALEAALGWLDGQGVDETVCLGDVVGYGGDPERCLEVVRARCPVTVRGNHDHAVYDPGVRRHFNDHAARAVERHAEMLGPDEHAWLASLPAIARRSGVGLGHASFADPDGYPYVTDSRRAASEFPALLDRVGFIGHTHVPAIFRAAPDGAVEQVVPGGPETAPAGAASAVSTRLEGPARYLVNPGAVGQPRDRDPRAACAVFDTSDGILTLTRIAYDVGGAQRAILERGLPAFEATRLTHGM